MARILIIDDEDQIRKLLRQILEGAGHTVIDAADGRTGGNLFRQEPADLVITDIFMPEMGGIETIHDLRREFPGVKIIAISGGARGGSFDFLPVAESFGARRTVSKPFTREEILTAIHEVLSDQS
ncbi:MAG: response regulator [Candidatus Ozemobacteraceae bacterium]